MVPRGRATAWTPEHPIHGLSDVVFFSNAPMCQFYYAEALEKDGTFGDAAVRAWKQAAAEWHEYGDRELPARHNVHSAAERPGNVRAAGPPNRRGAGQAGPGAAGEDCAEKRAKLSAAESAACETPLEKRTPEQIRLAGDAEPRLAVTNEEVARRVPDSPRRAALELAEQATHEADMATWVRQRTVPVNFEYWRLRAEVEQTAEAVAARKAMYDGDQAFAHGDLIAAPQAYEHAIKLWRTVLDRFPAFKEDINTGEELMARDPPLSRDAQAIGRAVPQALPPPGHHRQARQPGRLRAGRCMTLVYSSSSA